MVFRVIQSAGSASTIALGVGVVSDIATPEERGSFLGFSVLGPMVRDHSLLRDACFSFDVFFAVIRLRRV